ncbi:T-lymphocyte activation antigen CD86 isoform X2 [Enoplosus armatus]|uniref:T-lymphocyte activation antigen CD86 isoform X2 n=1 Tax=Enoplosus armatus TaxID=215367 RepID=UPI0039951A46
MAPRCNPQFLNLKLSLRLLAVLNMMWHSSVTEVAAQIQLTGEVGGNVTFRCPVAKPTPIKLFYLQKGQVFVNGYYASKNIEDKAWENTKLDRNKTTVHMNSLNISHSGDYQCHIISDSHTQPATVIHLTVTASYSKPKATMDCRDGLSCTVTCASHGYPGDKMMWNVTGSQKDESWKVVNRSEMNDPYTMMVNSSSTANFNCSNGELKFSCFVGDVTSNMFSVCTPLDPEELKDNVIVAAMCAVVVISFIMVILLLCWKCRKGQKGR